MKLLKHPLLSAVCVVLGALSAQPVMAQASDQQTPDQKQAGEGIQSGTSYQNDTSLPLYYMPAWTGPKVGKNRIAAENRKVPNRHIDSQDPVVQNIATPAPLIPAPILSFDGIGFPGVDCNCAPPDTVGDVGDTQYVQMVNNGLQVFNKATGATVLGPVSISSLWAGFGGACEVGGAGDPVVLYDQLSNRWLVSQFASPSGNAPMTHECVAISTSSDATGSWHRYGFQLGANFYDYPHLGVWPDGYYMAMNVFNASGTAYLGPQAFAFDRNAMLTGAPATFVTSGLLGSSAAPLLPADLEGANPPPIGSPNPFVEFPEGGTYKTYHFHVDFATPANSTWNLIGSPAAAGFSSICPGTRACVPQLGAGSTNLDAIGDRLMHRLAYRNFGSHESLVGNYTVLAGGVAGVRWFEMRGVTSGAAPTVFQESTFQPDTTWRWMGSAGMDTMGNIAVGYSASSAAINPQIRYAGRLATDAPGVLAQGEATLHAGTGSQQGTNSRWGDYSSMTVDPVDDCTFWYTQEYYATNAQFAWKTRIGNFKFANCSLAPGFSLAATPSDVSICAGTPAVYTVNAGSTAGFNGAVTLAALGNPVPSSAAFSTNPIPTLPGSSTLTIGNTAGAASGVYPIQINGTATGASNQGTSVDLTVFAGAPAAPVLTAPANGAASVPGTPTFTWTGSNTETYTIDVATDSAFTDIVYTQSVTGTSATPIASLAPNTTHYWRVTPANACGNGAVSAVFSFTTVNEICSAPGTPIPDSNPAGASDSLVVSDPALLSSLTVKIRSTHTWVGDLAFTLTKGASSAVVIDRPGVPASVNGCSGDNIDVELDDSSATPVETTCSASSPALSGVLRPNNPINAAFAGQALAGTWTLKAVDSAGGDVGTIDEWCLVPTTGSGPTYTVGGTVSGLVGSGLELDLNGSETLPLVADGVFAFTTPLADAAPYMVTVATQPGTPAQTCTVSNGSGNIAGANVTNVAVVCTTDPVDLIFADGFDGEVVVVCEPAQLLQDTSFEASLAGGPWASTSTNFGTAMCDEAGCGTGGGTAGPLTGSVWAWLGGAEVGLAETSTVSQAVVIPSGADRFLNFNLWVGSVNGGATNMDVTIDSDVVASFPEPAVAEAAYSPRSVDVSSYADGASHTVTFTYVSTGDASNYSLDDVSLDCAALPAAPIQPAPNAPRGVAAQRIAR